MRKNNYLWIFLAVAACSANSDSNEFEKEVYFDKAESCGEVENPLINEASGLAESLSNANMLWTHNDSGNDPFIFLIDEHGADRGTYELKGVVNRDWEDISSGPGPEEGKNYLYIAEMGDNYAVHEFKYIYRFIEPVAGQSRIIDNFETIAFQYPDGRRDAECLMVDPLSKDLYIISKREDQVGIYRARYPQSTEEVNILEKLGTIPYHNIVGGDISSDGGDILLKTYDQILYWPRPEGITVHEALQQEPLLIPYTPEPQGESIAWKKDESGFFTLSEERDSIEAVLYFYKKQ
ncbi:hypothetical protein GCM10009122_15340 [Fulvivirga kasyanovii]|uniref:PE-PGRS family protein n=1 Tax=Fulvivirga kasyanovii TaxID=396812 RepID=A0ABW9RYJ3_9BACT|nr:hypothetical protein [Fulvivirga kasyanovii]MTI29001.1 hypothetical protein [Fulvivirga kasyanovii]